MTDPDDRPAPGPRSRLALSAAVVVLLGASALLHVPGGSVADDVAPVGRAVLSAIGLEMDWVLFAPNPPDRSSDVVVRITYGDGSVQEWRPPHIEPWFGTYTRYRYGKLAEFATRGRQSDWAADQLLGSVVRLAQTSSSHGERPRVVAADLVVRTHPPSGEADPVWTEETIASLEVPA